jgi:hypothetical protein
MHGYEAVQIYQREGTSREEYIQSVKKADNHDYQPFENIIKRQLRQL